MKTKYEKINFEPLVKKSKNIRHLCRLMEMSETGSNFYTMKKYIKLHNINTDHYLNKKQQLQELHLKNKIPIEDILVENSTYSNNTYLKKRLVEEKVLEYKCEKCQNEGEWLGAELVLQLDHKNGINNDNRKNNLRFLCPNCHSQTDTYCGKHTSKKAERRRERLRNGGRTDKQLQHSMKQRKVKNRPSTEQLLEDIKNLGYTGTGKKYGVSDNAIRKWL